MKPTKSLPVLFAAVLAVAGGSAIATAQNVPAEGADNAPAASAQVNKADFRGHRGYSHDCGFGGRAGSGMMQQFFSQIDADSDGSITQEEIDAFRAAQVSDADTNGDGALSIEEFDTLYREMTRTRMVRAFQNLDVDGDGTISAAEMDNRFGAIVKQMDRNGDGALSLEDRNRDGGRKGGWKENRKGGHRG